LRFQSKAALALPRCADAQITNEFAACHTVTVPLMFVRDSVTGMKSRKRVRLKLAQQHSKVTKEAFN
jgi:hypothetical protein